MLEYGYRLWAQARTTPFFARRTSRLRLCRSNARLVAASSAIVMPMGDGVVGKVLRLRVSGKRDGVVKFGKGEGDS